MDGGFSDNPSRNPIFGGDQNGDMDSNRQPNDVPCSPQPPGLDDDAGFEDTTSINSPKTPPALPEPIDSPLGKITDAKSIEPAQDFDIGDTNESLLPGGQRTGQDDTQSSEPIQEQNGTLVEEDREAKHETHSEEATRVSGKKQRRRRRRARPSWRTWDMDLMPFPDYMEDVFEDDYIHRSPYGSDIHLLPRVDLGYEYESEREDWEKRDGSQSSSNTENSNNPGNFNEDDTPEEPDFVTQDWVQVLFEDEDLELITDDSPSRLEWLRQKKQGNEENIYLDAIMSMVGHEEIKDHFLTVKNRMKMAKRWNEDPAEINFDIILYGSKGTGKARIAQLYAEFLYSIGAVARRDFEKVSEMYYVHGNSCSTVTFISKGHGGVSTYDSVKDMLSALSNRTEPTALIFSFMSLEDVKKQNVQMDLESDNRFAKFFALRNYNEAEMVQLLQRLTKHEPEYKDLENDTIFPVLAQKCRKSLDQDGNPENMNALCCGLLDVERQRRKRLERQWVEWAMARSPVDDIDIEEQKSKDTRVVIEDVLGPAPGEVRKNSSAWKEVHNLVGIESVKKEIEHLFHLAEYNNQQERQGKEGLPVTLNRCFLGEPGVGKTTVAALYGQILTELGLLSQGQVITKTPNDLLGKYVGHSEAATKKALDEAMGNILIIDDAHMLYQSSEGREHSDVFRKGIIDTLVANISGSPGEDRCVILCGYPDKMEEMFLKTNPGLQRRFPKETAMVFKNYNDDELCQILDQKMVNNGMAASDNARKIAREVLSRMRTRPRFGNGGDVESLLSRARLRQVERLRGSGRYLVGMDACPLEPEDFDPDFNKASNADKNRNDLFEGFVGFENIINQFRGYQKMADGMRRYNVDPRPHIPWAFVFKGPPGTGKTSTARRIGRLFYDMGFISSDDVTTCSVTDFTGQYLGHTGPKVIHQFELGLGKVLFIDEAYRLAEDSTFHKEAIGEIVDAMTNPRYIGNMVVILAGYGEDMERLLQSNQGLRSRFPTHITFPHMTPGHCLQHLRQTVSNLNINLKEDINASGSEKNNAVLEVFAQLTRTKGWANGRDVETIATKIIQFVFIKAGEMEEGSDIGNLDLSFQDLMRFLMDMLTERNNGGRFSGITLPEMD